MSWIDRILGDTPQATTKRTRATRSAPARKPTGKHTFTLHAPICCPPRNSIEPMLAQYGIIQSWGTNRHMMSDKSLGSYFVMRDEERPNKPYSIGQEVTLTVNKQAARWVETLLRTHNFCNVAQGSVVGANVVRWVDQRNGRLPKPWISETCAEARRKK